MCVCVCVCVGACMSVCVRAAVRVLAERLERLGHFVTGGSGCRQKHLATLLWLSSGVSGLRYSVYSMQRTVTYVYIYNNYCTNYPLWPTESQTKWGMLRMCSQNIYAQSLVILASLLWRGYIFKRRKRKTFITSDFFSVQQKETSPSQWIWSREGKHKAEERNEGKKSEEKEK